MASRRRDRILTAALVVCSIGLAGCGRSDPSETIRVTWTLDPSPPLTSAPLVVHLTLRDAAHKPVSGARLRLEGVMSHPGMAPINAAVTDRGNGEYEAPLQFTMAGDWILLVTGELPNGTPFRKQIEINGVRPAS
jgi:hypothetical protein